MWILPNEFNPVLRIVRKIVWHCTGIAQTRKESPVFFVRQGVAVGAARRFVNHTRLWLKEREKGHCLIYCTINTLRGINIAW